VAVREGRVESAHRGYVKRSRIKRAIAVASSQLAVFLLSASGFARSASEAADRASAYNSATRVLTTPRHRAKAISPDIRREKPGDTGDTAS
jgi:hypothetical protein